MSNKLKLDNNVERITERGSIRPPKTPLTKKELERLSTDKKFVNKCIGAYVNRMLKSRHYNVDTEDARDIYNDGYLFFINILGKFDKAPFKGKIAKKYDVPGKNIPKTIEFYFYDYFCRRINYASMESSKYKQNWGGTAPVDTMGEIVYDEETTERSGFLETSIEDEDWGKIFKELEKENFEFKRFYTQLYFLEITEKELREDYGERFNDFYQKSEDFHRKIREK